MQCSRQYHRFLNILFGYVSVAQLVASVSGVVLGGVAEVMGSNLARGKIFTASIGSVDSLYIYIALWESNVTNVVSMQRYIKLLMICITVKPVEE